jgi:hypothetical protein
MASGMPVTLYEVLQQKAAEPAPVGALRPLAARMLDKIAIDAASGCWIWTGYVSNTKLPYGKVGIRRPDGTNGMGLVHRVMYQLLVGPIPEGLTIDHLCGNPPCCYPEHLSLATLRENISRRREYPTCRHGHARSEHAFTRSDGTWRCKVCAAKAKKKYRDRTGK